MKTTVDIARVFRRKLYRFFFYAFFLTALQGVPLLAEEEEKAGLTFVPFPWLIASSDLGVGPVGLFVATRADEGYDPYRYQVIAGGGRTNLGYEAAFVNIDALRVSGSIRMKAGLGYERNLEARYFGYGNYHDIRRQQQIESGERPVGPNVPASSDLLQGSEASLNRDYFSNPSTGFNPGQRFLRESQNRYYQYENKNIYGSLSLENWIADSKFKWSAGVYLNQYRIYPYGGEKENNNTVPNVPTLLEQEKPVGFDAVYNTRYANLLSGAIFYDSRPPEKEVHPDSGIYAGARLEHSEKAWGSDYRYGRVSGFYTQYIEVLPDFFASHSQDLIFAYRFSGAVTYGQIPFFEEKGLSYNVVRGYRKNQFLDRVTAAGGIEMWYTFLKTGLFDGTDFILVSFFDTGRVAPEMKALTGSGWHRAAGGGINLLVSKNTLIEFVYGVSTFESYFELSIGHTFAQMDW